MGDWSDNLPYEQREYAGHFYDTDEEKEQEEEASRTSDYISREKAIKSICQYGTAQEKIGRYAVTISELKQTVADTLSDLPSADVRENRWIPVSERLPDNNVRVLCSAISTSISGGYTRFVGCCDNGDWFVQTDAETVSYPRQYKVTAWMPLPSPWKGGE